MSDLYNGNTSTHNDGLAAYWGDPGYFIGAVSPGPKHYMYCLKDLSVLVEAKQASSRFNPLSEVRVFMSRDVSDAQNIANMIVRTGEDSPQERYWQDAAASITTGMILHVCYEVALEGRVACLADLSHVFTRPGSGFRETLDELLNFEHDPGHAHDWRMSTGDQTLTHPVVREKVQEMVRQGGPRLRRRPLNREDGAHALQRSACREEHLGERLYHRTLQDEDNQRLLDGIGLQHDPKRVLLFLHDPSIEPTNNGGERALRPAVARRSRKICSTACGLARKVRQADCQSAAG